MKQTVVILTALMMAMLMVSGFIVAGSTQQSQLLAKREEELRLAQTAITELETEGAKWEREAERSAKLSAAKFIVNRAARAVAEQSIQLHGGIAMTWEYNGAHYAKRLVMISHQFGDDDHHLEAYSNQLVVA